MKNLRRKATSLIMSSILLVYSGFGTVAPALATEASSSSQINWNDPNNWYEKWTAERAARRAAAEAAAAAAAANTNTGADSTNSATSTTTNNTNADVNNNADIVNVTSGDADTGGNNSDRNTGDGSVVSGNASLTASLSSEANKVSIAGLEGDACLQLGCTGTGGTADNSNTGSGSSNDASSDSENNIDINVDNTLDVQNIALLTSDSGHNSASRNTGNGSIVSGDADLTVTALNVGNNVNVGAQVFNVMDDQTGDLVLNFDDIETLQIAGAGTTGASNDTTGADSTNNASTTNSNNNLIVINNDGTIANDYILNADTGNNDASRNTGDGSITTGDANVAVNVINFLNNTFLGGSGELLLGVVNIFGTLNGNIVINNPPPSSASQVISPEALAAANLQTGADSENNAGSSSSSNLGINTNNTADVLNGITLNANTGGNDASRNTGSSSIQTGDVNTNLKTTTIANTTTVGSNGDLWLVLVNNLGTWTGQLMGLNANGVASPFFSFVVGPDGSLMAVNNTTGAGSTNNADASNSNNTDININNNGSVDNNIVVNANTGNNTANMNTGNGSIQTGDVNVAANILNILNNNFIGSRLIVTIVNVFGSFNGNVLPPGTTSPAAPKANEINTTNHLASTGSGGLAAPFGTLNAQSNSQSPTSKAKKVESLVLAASDNFGTPNVTKVVRETSGNLNLRNIVFMMIITAASVQLALKVVRRRWLIRKN